MVETQYHSIHSSGSQTLHSLPNNVLHSASREAIVGLAAGAVAGVEDVYQSPDRRQTVF